MLIPRPVSVTIYDLVGRRIWSDEKLVRAGPHTFTWDGLMSGGQLTLPGLYLLELEVNGDAREEKVRRTLGVAY